MKTGLLKKKYLDVFTKLVFAASILHGFGLVISHIKTENAWRVFSLS